jgi:hypothetical protein
MLRSGAPCDDKAVRLFLAQLFAVWNDEMLLIKIKIEINICCATRLQLSNLVLTTA